MLVLNVNSEVKVSGNTVITHAGVFHLDETLAVTLLNLFWGRIENVVRIPHQMDPEKVIVEDGEKFVLDVGRNYDEEFLRFDHHQFEPGHEFKNISSAGLIYRWLVKDIDKLNNKLLPKVDKIKALVEFADANDTGVRDLVTHEFDIAAIVSGMNYTDIYSDYQTERFKKVVDMLETFVWQAYEIAVKMEEGREILKNGEVIGDVLYVPEYINSWQELIHQMPEFNNINILAWYDKVQNKYKAQNVPALPDSFAPRKEDRIVRYTNPLPKGCEFLHTNNFFGVWDNKEDMIKYLTK